VNEHNAEVTPVAIHRAIYGSMERFIGILIEHYAGAFPVWLAPVQAKVMSISEKAADYAREVYDRLFAEDLRVELDVRDDKIGAKIRDAQLEKVPYMLVVGAKEAESRSVAVRSRERGDEGAVPLEEFVARIKGEASFDY
jgi:threonyl-tRNA synthetase